MRLPETPGVLEAPLPFLQDGFHAGEKIHLFLVFSENMPQNLFLKHSLGVKAHSLIKSFEMFKG